MSALQFFDAARAYKRELLHDPDIGLNAADMAALRAVEALWKPKADYVPGTLTCRMALELIGHEAIVQEAYKDSAGVWTWGIGVTNASGHTVFPRYKDNPQTIERCLEVFLWLLREKYIPPVLKAFATKPLTEEQFAAALSFHYNTGAIATATWVKQWLSGDDVAAHRSFIMWNRPREILPRRNRERDLFFDGRWSGVSEARVLPVRRPSYTPSFKGVTLVDVCPIVERLLA